jgi:hypothetical protein
MADEPTTWERETFAELLDVFEEDDDACVVLDENDIEEGNVCVMPVQLDEPSGGTAEYFVIWRADDITCHDNLLWSWQSIPLVWNVGYQGGWDSHASGQCGTCGARDGTWCELVGGWEDIDKVKTVVEKMRYRGFEPDVAKAWLSHGFTLAEAEQWSNEFSPENAKEWKTLSDDYLLSFSEIVAWRASGFSVSEVYEWSYWKNNFDPDTAAEWRDAGFDVENAREWRDMEFDADEATKWRDAGFDAKKADALRGADLTPETAASNHAPTPPLP